MDDRDRKKECDPVLKRLSRMNGNLNRMNKDELVDLLYKLRLETRGHKEVLRKRLKTFYKRQKLFNVGAMRHFGDDEDSRRTGIRTQSTSSSSSSMCTFDFLCVIDFEATCEQERSLFYRHEIIEFPAVLICVHSRKIVREFHRFCRPHLNPMLTPFCTQLTGITQETVDSAQEFAFVLDEFKEWLKQNKLGTEFTYAIVTDGPWDMGHFLAGQCQLSQLKFPKFGRKWINIRKTFSNFYDCNRLNLEHMLEKLGRKFDGRQHSGLDDSRNIARIALDLLSDGAVLRINENIQGSRTYPLKNYQIEDHSDDSDNEVSNKKSSPNKFKKRPTRDETVVCIEEQMTNLGIDPSDEGSSEALVEKKLTRNTWAK